MAGTSLDDDLKTLGMNSHAELQKQIEQIEATRAAYARLKVSGTLTGAELAQAAFKAKERIRELREQTGDCSDSFANARTALNGLVRSGEGIATVVNQAIAFESAMAEMSRSVDGTDEQIAALGSRIKELASEIPGGVAGLTQIAAAGGLMGVPIEQMAQFTELAGQMSTAFGLGAEQTGKSVATLAKTFGLPLEKVEELGNAISVLGSTTSASSAGIVDVLTRIGDSAKQFGLSAEQAAALGSAMLGLGGTTASASAGINTMLSKLQNANTQGKGFQDALGVMGMSARQLAKDIQADPQAALTGFLRTLEKLDSQSRTLVLTKMFGADKAGDILRLVEGAGQYEKALTDVANGARTAGAMQADFRKHVGTTEAQINLLRESVGVLGTNLGTILLPAIQPVVSGLVDITSAAAKFAENHPAIAGLAGVLVTAATSVGSLRLAFGAMSTVGTQSLGAISGALKGLGVELDAAQINAGRVGAGLRAAGNLAAAGWIGWEIGTYLKNNFEEVELAGIALAAGLTKAAAYAQSAWEMLKAPFTDDTMAAASARLQANLRGIDDTYAQIFEDAQKGHEAQAKGARDVADATKKAAEGLKEAASEAGRFRTVLDDVSKLDAAGLGGIGTDIEEAFKAGKLSAKEFAELNDKVLSASFQRLGIDATIAMGDISDASLDAIAAAVNITTLLEAAGIKGEQAGRAIEIAFTAAIGKADNERALVVLKTQLDNIAASGSVGADGVARLGAAMDAARQRVEDATPGIQSAAEALRMLNAGNLDAGKLGKIGSEITAAFQQGTLSAKEFAELNNNVVAVSFQRLGLDAATAMGGIGAASRDAIAAVTNITASLDAAGIKGAQAGRAIEAALAAAIGKADSEQTLAALQKQLDGVAASGSLSADGVARLGAAMDAARQRVEDATPGIQSVSEAFRQLGVVSDAQLRVAADNARTAFEAIRISGTASARELEQSFIVYAKAAITANNGTATEALKVQAAISGVSIEVDSAGKTIVRSMQEAADATKSVGESATKAAGNMAEIGAAAEDAAGWVERTWDENGNLIEQASKEQSITMVEPWLKGAAAASQYADEAIKSVYAAYQAGEMQIGQLDEAANRYVAAMESIDRRQASLGTSSGVARDIENLSIRLLELNGTEEQVAAARQARDEAEVKRQIALLGLDLERARVRGDQDEARRLEQEISLSRKKLSLIAQVYEAEKKQREKDAADAKRKAEEEARDRAKKKAETDADEARRAKNAVPDTRSTPSRGGDGSGAPIRGAGPALVGGAVGAVGTGSVVNITLQPGVDLSNRMQVEQIARSLMPAIENLSRRGV